MGVKHAIYRDAATGIGTRVPNARREVCHRSGRPGDDEARNPLRSRKTVSKHPHRAFVILLSLSYS